MAEDKVKGAASAAEAGEDEELTDEELAAVQGGWPRDRSGRYWATKHRGSGGGFGE